MFNGENFENFDKLNTIHQKIPFKFLHNPRGIKKIIECSEQLVKILHINICSYLNFPPFVLYGNVITDVCISMSMYIANIELF